MQLSVSGVGGDGGGSSVPWRDGLGTSGGVHYISLNKGYDKHLLKVCTRIYLAHLMHWLEHKVYFIDEYHNYVACCVP